MMKKKIGGLVLMMGLCSSVQATPFENAAIPDPAIKQILLDVGARCGVDATQATGGWIMGVLSYGLNAEAKETAIRAFHGQDDGGYQQAITRFICP